MKTPGSDHDLIANGGASSVLTALVSVLVLGFLLGMRHATDPDHVVAVTTIVAQQRSLARAARTGVLWGIGHTATILLVGGAIVLLKVRLSGIPARLGLSLELAVAVMLIVLGLLTLAGNDRRVTESTARPASCTAWRDRRRWRRCLRWR